MSAEKRRTTLREILTTRPGPINASSLAGELGVSRQVIVGDIALLRAAGLDIIATARGYMLTPVVTSGRFVGKIACQHSLDQTEQELAAIVSLGGEILDVVVSHYLYGEITGQLNITTQADVQDFIRRVRHNEAKLLSELTDGIHLHTVACADKATFDAILAELKAQGFLYREPV